MQLQLHLLSWHTQFLVFQNSFMKLIRKSLFKLTFLPFHIDTHHTEPLRHSARWWRSTTSCHCSPTKQCNIPSFSSKLSFFLFDIDTHHTQPRLQSDRCWRSTTSCHCSPTKQCNIATFSSNLSLFLFRIDTHHTQPWQ
jgi:hypothetical protein